MASPVEKDQVLQGQDRLVTQWKDKPVVQGLLQSYTENIQAVEDIYQQLLTERSVFTAIGAQLDVVGTIVGEARQGKSDAAYRLAIFNRIAINTADATPEKIMEILLTITDATTVRIFEHYPASTHTFINGSPTNATARILDNISAAGVSGARLMFDGGIDSFIGAAAIQDASDLALENSDELALENSDLLGIISTNIIPVGNRSSLPHSLETEIINPLCGLFDGTVYQVDIGDLVDQSGNILVFENEDSIEYQIVEAI